MSPRFCWAAGTESGWRFAECHPKPLWASGTPLKTAQPGREGDNAHSSGVTPAPAPWACREKEERKMHHWFLLPPHSLHSFCHCHSLPDSRRCPEPWGSSVVSGSAFPTLRPPKALGSLRAVCPQAHTPWQGWPSLAGLSGFGCSHACSDPAPGSAGCVTVGGVGGSRDGILHWSPHPSMSPGPEFGSHPPGGPRVVPSWGMWRPGWCGVTEVVLVTLNGPTQTTCGCLESPGLAAAAGTSPWGQPLVGHLSP